MFFMFNTVAAHLEAEPCRIRWKSFQKLGSRPKAHKLKKYPNPDMRLQPSGSRRFSNRNMFARRIYVAIGEFRPQHQRLDVNAKLSSS